MKLILVPLQTKLARKDRVEGWRAVKLDRISVEYLDDVARRLNGKLPENALVAASDLHELPATYLARKLNIPVRLQRNLRGFNVGRSAGLKVSEIDGIMASLSKRWSKNEIIPIAGGDSWISYKRRIEHAIDTFDRDTIVLLEPREIAMIRHLLVHDLAEPLLSSQWPAPGRIYVVKVNGPDKELGPSTPRSEHQPAAI